MLNPVASMSAVVLEYSHSFLIYRRVLTCIAVISELSNAAKKRPARMVSYREAL